MNEWETEPNTKSWKSWDQDCLAIRHPEMLTWNGYVAVPQRVLDKGLDLECVLSVHGGVTYQGEGFGQAWFGAYMDPKKYWVGFDCNHCYDLSPGMVKLREQYKTRLPPPSYTEVYRNLDWVMQETATLAEQIYQLGL